MLHERLWSRVRPWLPGKLAGTSSVERYQRRLVAAATAGLALGLALGPLTLTGITLAGVLVLAGLALAQALCVALAVWGSLPATLRGPQLVLAVAPLPLAIVVAPPALYFAIWCIPAVALPFLAAPHRRPLPRAFLHLLHGLLALGLMPGGPLALQDAAILPVSTAGTVWNVLAALAVTLACTEAVQALLRLQRDHLSAETRGERGQLVALERDTDALGEQLVALEDALVEARRAEEANDLLLARLQHEIRTPLHALVGLPAEPGAEAARRRLHEEAQALLDTLAEILGEDVGRSLGDRPPVRHGPVLVVDDNPLNRRIATMQLARLGFPEVVEAGDGFEAVAAFAPRRFALVLMDLEMPGMDGFEAIRHLRAADDARDPVPVVAVTGHTQPRLLDAAIAAGADLALSKPLTPDSLAWLQPRTHEDARQAG
jgi:CheY-like chemotaxis protein